MYIKNYILCEMNTFDDEKEKMPLNEPINYNKVKFAIKNLKTLYYFLLNVLFL